MLKIKNIYPWWNHFVMKCYKIRQNLENLKYKCCNLDLFLIATDVSINQISCHRIGLNINMGTVFPIFYRIFGSKLESKIVKFTVIFVLCLTIGCK